LPTSGGFLAHEKFAADVRRHQWCALRAAGAVIVAKVNMSDWFGVAKPGDQSTVLGRTSNPSNLDLNAGGSSGARAHRLLHRSHKSGSAVKPACRYAIRLP